MSNPLFIDKENALKTINPKRALEAENFKASGILQQKSDKNLANEGRRKIMRVPLGGKDQNMTLNRSQTSLTSNVVKNTFRRKPLGPKVPSFGRANSSLGFTHNKQMDSDASIVNVPPLEKFLSEEQQDHSKLKEVKLSSDQANRSKALLDLSNVLTDSLEKPNISPLPRLSQSLQETITPSTDQLNSLNLINHDIHYNNVDPVKRLTKKRRLDAFTFFKNKEPAFDAEVETMPEKAIPLPYTPFSMDSLNNEDLGFFTSSNRTRPAELSAKPVMTMEAGLKSVTNLEPFELDFGNEIVNENENAHDTADLGLTIDELNDLLD